MHNPDTLAPGCAPRACSSAPAASAPRLGGHRRGGLGVRGWDYGEVAGGWAGGWKARALGRGQRRSAGPALHTRPPAHLLVPTPPPPSTHPPTHPPTLCLHKGGFVVGEHQAGAHHVKHVLQEFLLLGGGGVARAVGCDRLHVCVCGGGGGVCVSGRGGAVVHACVRAGGWAGRASPPKTPAARRPAPRSPPCDACWHPRPAPAPPAALQRTAGWSLPPCAARAPAAT